MQTALVDTVALKEKTRRKKTLYVFITFSLKPSERQVPASIRLTAACWSGSLIRTSEATRPIDAPFPRFGHRGIN
jgi:hypothetical protein